MTHLHCDVSCQDGKEQGPDGGRTMLHKSSPKVGDEGLVASSQASAEFHPEGSWFVYGVRK